MARPASRTVALPRWVVALLVAACAVCLSGNMSGFEELIATQRALHARMAEVLPPAACREHHQRSLRLIGRAIALLERTRDAVAGRNTSDLASVATEGHAIEEEARATDALANDLRRAAGLPLVP
jgi:hypothetical protein